MVKRVAVKVKASVSGMMTRNITTVTPPMPVDRHASATPMSVVRSEGCMARPAVGEGRSKAAGTLDGERENDDRHSPGPTGQSQLRLSGGSPAPGALPGHGH